MYTTPYKLAITIDLASCEEALKKRPKPSPFIEHDAPVTSQDEGLLTSDRSHHHPPRMWLQASHLCVVLQLLQPGLQPRPFQPPHVSGCRLLVVVPLVPRYQRVRGDKFRIEPKSARLTVTVPDRPHPQCDPTITACQVVTKCSASFW